jgi:hypothetical protein
MEVYRFVIHGPDGEGEDLGYMTLFDDKDAVSFGKAVMQESGYGELSEHAGSMMVITDGEQRTVRKIKCGKI